MPIFEYHCNECDKDFEILIMGDEEVSCPDCAGKDVSKLLSTFSHKSEGQLASPTGSSCSACNATSCATCGSS
jgi:putative FmdB family regulatory protein